MYAANVLLLIDVKFVIKLKMNKIKINYVDNVNNNKVLKLWYVQNVIIVFIIIKILKLKLLFV